MPYVIQFNIFPDASTKSHASGKIKHRSIRMLKIGSDVFFDADSESLCLTLSGPAAAKRQPSGAPAARPQRGALISKNKF